MKTINRRHLLGAATSLTLAASHRARAEDAPIRWIVPYTPGGLTDTLTRLVTNQLGTALKRTIVIDNRPGANSIIGAELAARAAPDGTTFLSILPGHAANVTLYAGKLSFDPERSFTPISLLGIAPFIVAASPNLPASNTRDFIAYAKANPGKISFGSSGVGSAAHLTSELLKQMTGIDMVHVPYRGTAPALQDLMSGQIQILLDVAPGLMPSVQGGRIKALAVLSQERLPVAPDVPTMAEAGGPALEASSWVMAMAPAGTPAPIVETVSREITRIVTETDVKQRFIDLGVIPSGWSPERSARFFADEVLRWRRVIETAQIRLEG